GSIMLDPTIKIWDTRTGEKRLTVFGHLGVVQSVAFSPNGKQIASGSLDKTVRIWDAATGKRIFIMKGGDINRVEGDIIRVAFSPDGSRLASTSDDRSVIVWDTSTGKE